MRFRRHGAECRVEEHNPEDELIEEVAEYCYDPAGYKIFAFPWGEKGSELEDSPGPRKWAQERDKALGKHLQNPKTRFQPFLSAIGSGHGIGKSADIGQTINWGMSCFEDCKVLWTANTLTQLRTKTNPEISKWHRLSITSQWFKMNKESIHSVDKQHEETWRGDAVTWSKENTEAFAGLHNKGKCIIVIFDEASAIHDKVWEVTEGALTDEDTVIIWLVYGNITRATGRFRECFRKFKHRWWNRQVDSRTVEGTNKQQIQQWEDDHGVDSDFFKVRVRGMPPSQSTKQFISETLADAAFGKHLREEEYNFAPKIIAVEPAWEGDDELVIAMRQGLHFKILETMPRNDNDIEVAQKVANYEDAEDADAVFIDLGYGTGIYSAGKTWNRTTWRLVNFGEGPADTALGSGCLNKRSEMWLLAKEWLKEGGSIPPDTLLHQELMAPETVARLDGKLQLEAKKHMKERGVPSPNRADALAITFAYPVKAKEQFARKTLGRAKHVASWKPGLRK